MKRGKDRSSGVAVEAVERAQRALTLLNSETADAIIGSADEEYTILIQGTQGIMALLWGVLKQECGLRETPRGLLEHSKALLMITTLVQYAYALGIRRGEGRR